MILHYKVQITIYRIYSIWSVAVATLRPELSGLFIFYNAGNINFLHLFYVSDYFTCFFSSEFIQMSLLHHSQTSTFYFIKHNITRVEDPLRGFLFLSSWLYLIWNFQYFHNPNKSIAPNILSSFKSLICRKRNTSSSCHFFLGHPHFYSFFFYHLNNNLIMQFYISPPFFLDT